MSSFDTIDGPPADTEGSTVTTPAAPNPPQRPLIPPPGQKGAAAWALGFLAYVPIPVIAQIMTGLIMAGVYPTQRKRGPIAHANARNAANWGLTYSVMTVALFGLALIFAVIISNGGTETVRGPVTALPAIPLLLWCVLCVVHVVVTIVGTVKATRGSVFRFPLAIRFISQ